MSSESSLWSVPDCLARSWVSWVIWLRAATRFGVRRRARQGLVPSLARTMRLGPSVYVGVFSDPAADQNGCVPVPSAFDGFGEWEQLGISTTDFFE